MKNDLPKGWKIKKLGEIISKMGSGVTPKGGRETYLSEGIPLIRSQNVLNGELDLSDVAFISEKQHNKISGSKLKPNDVLLNITGASIGRSCVLPNDFIEGNVNQHVCIIRTKPNELRPFILSQYFLSINGQRIIDSYQVGGNRQGLNYDQLKSFEIPIPPLPEQQKIAQILSTWDEAIQTTQHLLDKLESRKKGMMQKLLNRKGNEKNAGIVFKTFSEKNHPNEPLLSATQDRGVIPRTMLAGRVASPDGSTSGYKLVQEGDFIISLRSFEGGLEYSEYRGIISPAYTILQPKVPIDRSFYKHFFKSERFIRRLGVAVIGIRDGKQISFEDFSIIKIPFPSLEEQSAIAKILNTAETEIQETKAYLKTLKHQKKGLMQQLLTGKIIVKTDG